MIEGPVLRVDNSVRLAPRVGIPQTQTASVQRGNGIMYYAFKIGDGLTFFPSVIVTLKVELTCARSMGCL